MSDAMSSREATKRTDIVATSRCSRYTIYPTSDAVAQGKRIIVLAEHAATVCFDGFDSTLRRTGRGDMHSCLQEVRTLENITSEYGERGFNDEDTNVTQKFDAIVHVVHTTAQQQFPRCNGLFGC